jgi:uncharacterized protein (DUF302 family)
VSPDASNTPDGPQDVITKLSPRSVSETVQRFTDILESKGVRVFAVIDQAAAARDAGSELRETTMVIFGNPKAGTPVMVASPLAALDLPLRIVIWADGGQTNVSYYDPASTARRFDVPADAAGGLAAIGPLTDALVST